MTRTEYLNQFDPSNRTRPALLWDRYHEDALSSLPPTEAVIDYGVSMIASFEEHAASLYGGDVPHARKLATGQHGVDSAMARYRDVAVRAIARHRENNGGVDHISVEGAQNINFVGFYLDQ